MAILIAISSIVIVHDGQQHVISRFGRVMPERTLGEPGMYFKLPWPVETSRAFDTGRLYELHLGAGHEQHPDIVEAGTFKGREMALWTEEHGHHDDQDFLLAVPPRKDRTSEAADVSIIKLGAMVQYRITEPLKFGYKYADAGEMLESLANREMVQYCSSATLDTPIPGDRKDRPEAIMTYGRRAAADRLKTLIETAVAKMDLGVEIVSVSFLIVHPPAEAAISFEKVLEARLRQRQQRYLAQAKAVTTLSRVAGNQASAMRLALAISLYQKLDSTPSPLEQPGKFADNIKEHIRIAELDTKDLVEYIKRDAARGKASQSITEGGDSLKALHQDYLDNIKRLKRLLATQDKSKAAGMLKTFAAESRKQADDRLLNLRTGSASAMIAKATADRWRHELSERGKAESFARQTALHEAGPQIFKLDQWLDAWDKVLKGKHKYVIGLDPNRIEHWLKWEGRSGVMPGLFGGGSSNTGQ